MNAMKGRDSYYTVLISVLILVLVFNVIITATLYVHTKETISDYFDSNAKTAASYRLDALLLKVSSNVENKYKIKIPPVSSITILFSQYSQTGIKYLSLEKGGPALELNIPNWIFDYKEDIIKAYFYHEFMHFALCHLQKSRGYFVRDLNLEKEADKAALQFVDRDSMVYLINFSSWDQEEKAARIEAIIIPD